MYTCKSVKVLGNRLNTLSLRLVVPECTVSRNRTKHVRNVVVVFVLSTVVLGLSLLLSLQGQLVGSVNVASYESHHQLFILALVAEILETVLLFTLISSSV